MYYYETVGVEQMSQVWRNPHRPNPNLNSKPLIFSSYKRNPHPPNPQTIAMVLTTPLSPNSNQTLHFSTTLTTPNHNEPIKTTQKQTITSLKLHTNQMGRRKLSSFSIIFTTTTFSLLLPSKEEAKAEAAGPGPFDFLRMTVPGQTKEQADAVIKDHALRLLQVKELLEEESWKDSQRELRKSSAELKQDLYTIIQAKPGNERPPLRELYYKLFNSVTRLDFAARDKDVTLVKECYDYMVAALKDVFAIL